MCLQVIIEANVKEVFFPANRSRIFEIMKLIYIILFAVAIVFSSCKDDDPKKTVELLTVNAVTHTIPYDEVWFVAWDDVGKLLDFKKYVEGETLTLTTTESIANDKISVGFLRYRGDDSSTETITSIYTDLTPGISFTRDLAGFGQEPAGSFFLKLTNEPSFGYPNLSGKYGLVATAGSGENGTTVYECFPTTDATKYIVTWVGLPGVYGELNDVSAGESFELDASNLKPFDTEVTINMPSEYNFMSIFFRGFESDQAFEEGGYFLDQNNTSIYSPTYKTGYFPGVSKFGLELSINLDDAYVVYQKYGSLPGTISWPDPGKYFINSSDLTSFSVSVTGDPVEYIAAQWFNTVGTDFHSLYVTSPKLAPKIGEIPADIVAARPGFALTTDNLPRSQVGFILKGSQSYESEVAEYFSGKTVEQEVMRVTIPGN